MAVDHFLGNNPVFDESALAVYIFQDQVEQFGALFESGFHGLPFTLMHQKRYYIQIPGAMQSLWIVIHIVSHPVFRKQPVDVFLATGQPVNSQFFESIHQLFPLRFHTILWGEHLVVPAKRAVI